MGNGSVCVAPDGLLQSFHFVVFNIKAMFLRQREIFTDAVVTDSPSRFRSLEQPWTWTDSFRDICLGCVA